MAVPPAAVIISAVSSIVSGRPYGDGLPRTLRPVQYTMAPASASPRAMPRPAPRVAPATTATRPASGLLDALRSLTTRFAVGVFARRGIAASFVVRILPLVGYSVRL